MSLWRKRQVEEYSGETKRIRNLSMPDTSMGNVAVLLNQGERQPTSPAQHLHDSGDKPRHHTGGAQALPRDQGA
jgi:hypothetical protein